MIHWMSSKIKDVLDNYKDGGQYHIPVSITVCCGSPVGYKSLICKVADEIIVTMNLGDCLGASDYEIKARFVNDFVDMAKDYWNKYFKYATMNTIPEDHLVALAAAMEKTL